MDPADAMRLLPSKHNTALAPNWRWERARMLREEGRYVRRKKEDPWVVLISKFQKELDAAKTLIAHERLARRYPALYWAWQIYRHSLKDTRWGVEAFLCAATPLKHIADFYHQDTETIGAFAFMFFDVIGKTDHKLYMMNEVLGRSVATGVAEREYDLLWKLIGILKGPILLEVFVKKDRTPGPVTSFSNAGPAMHGLWRDAVTTKAYSAIHSLPVSYNQEIIFNTMTKITELEKSSEDPQLKQGLIMNQISGLFQSLTFNFGRPDRVVDAQEMKAYDECGAELRADESFQLSVGKKLPAPKQLLALHYPEGKNEHNQQGS